MEKSTVKKVAGFLFLKPAMTTRNATSFGLVGLFIVVYIAAGGKIDWVPNVRPGDSFGSVQGAPAQQAEAPARAESSKRTEVKREAPVKEAPRASSRQNIFEDEPPVETARPARRTAAPAAKNTQRRRPDSQSAPAAAGGEDDLTDLSERLNRLKQRTGDK